MVFTVTVDGTVYRTDTDRDIGYAIIGRVAAGKPVAEGTATAPTPRQVLGWLASRDEAEISLQTLFRQGLFSDLEIVRASRG
ncbi:MAG: hypothetical protein H6Q30_789 [Bacteroidetes bacterium]|nr:hypothetical protein [Bacteroidota bacterium]